MIHKFTNVDQEFFSYLWAMSIFEHDEFALRLHLGDANVTLSRPLEASPGRSFTLDHSHGFWKNKI